MFQMEDMVPLSETGSMNDKCRIPTAKKKSDRLLKLSKARMLLEQAVSGGQVQIMYPC
jgi:hypothetical protein